MSHAGLEAAIEAAWEARDTITPETKGETRDAIEETLDALDAGRIRVAERMANGEWPVRQWAKKAVLLGFRLKDMEAHEGGPQGSTWWDKVDSKFHGWKKKGWRTAGGQPVKNAELWRQLDELAHGAGHRIDWHWVKGHAGDPGNERADALANRGVEQALGR